MKLFLKIFILVWIVFIFSFTRAYSAPEDVILYMMPPQESQYVGKIFSVIIKLTSLYKSVNAVEGDIKFSKDKIELINISKVGSVASVWIQGPVFSNNNGTVKFTAGIPSPGFAGPEGTVLTLVFRAVTEGPATIVWEKSAVLANDGKGTNVLTTSENANYLITPSLLESPPPRIHIRIYKI